MNTLEQGIIVLNQKNMIIGYNVQTENILCEISQGLNLDFYDFMTNLKGDCHYDGKNLLRINDKTYQVTIYSLVEAYYQIVIIDIKTQSIQYYYENIIDTIPDMIVIVQDDEIKLANKAAKKLVKNIVGNSIEDLLRENSNIANGRIQEVIKKKTVGMPIDYRIYTKNNDVYEAELIPAYIDYNGRPAVLSIARDITTKKAELKEAARMQKILLSKKIPTFDHIMMRMIYMPSKTVSGDFYFFEKKNDHTVIGILGDVRGKGITAAMKISAFEVLFREMIHSSPSFESFAEILNCKVMQYFDDFYVAGILFMLDFKNKKITFLGAGINEFKIYDQNKIGKTIKLRGPFLGMFDQLPFDRISLNIEDYSRILLYSDGFEENIMCDSTYDQLLSQGSIFDIKQDIKLALEDKTNSLRGLSDDSTMIIMDLNYEGKHGEYYFLGLSEISSKLKEILKDIQMDDYVFEIKLIITELLTNAYKYGNKRQNDLPIILRYTFYESSLFIEVTDLGLTKKQFEIKESIEDEMLLEESGRGLFLINQFAKCVTTNSNTVVVELLIGGNDD